MTVPNQVDPEVAAVLAAVAEANVGVAVPARGDWKALRARAGAGQDLAGLPPAYVETGELDIFRDEDIGYARRLAAAGVPVELHVHPGAPHGFDRFAPSSRLARRAFADRARVLGSL